MNGWTTLSCLWRLWLNQKEVGHSSLWTFRQTLNTFSLCDEDFRLDLRNKIFLVHFLKRQGSPAACGQLMISCYRGINNLQEGPDGAVSWPPHTASPVHVSTHSVFKVNSAAFSAMNAWIWLLWRPVVLVVVVSWSGWLTISDKNRCEELISTAAGGKEAWDRCDWWRVLERKEVFKEWLIRDETKLLAHEWVSTQGNIKRIKSDQ